MVPVDDNGMSPDGGESALVLPPALPHEERHALLFGGKGSEYFGIWAVNLFLTIITFGIYSAWAKVRRLQYFYRHTQLAGAGFDYHGNPVAILKGRLIAVAMLFAYNLALTFLPWLAGLMVLAFMLVLPRLLLKSLQFRLYNSSYRGLRFHFNGKTGDAYRVFLGWPLASLLTLSLLWPLCHQRIKAFQHRQTAFGQSAFSFSAPVRAFYGCYLKILGIVLLGVFVVGVAAAVFGGAFLVGAGRSSPQAMTLFPLLLSLSVFLLFFFIRPFIEAQLQNLVWNHTRLGEHRFVSSVSVMRLFWIMLSNLLGIICTLGLYRPFAVIRLLRYRLQTVTLVAVGDLDRFVAGASCVVGATGEEAAEVFDIDITL